MLTVRIAVNTKTIRHLYIVNQGHPTLLRPPVDDDLRVYAVSDGQGSLGTVLHRRSDGGEALAYRALRRWLGRNDVDMLLPVEPDHEDELVNPVNGDRNEPALAAYEAGFEAGIQLITEALAKQGIDIEVDTTTEAITDSKVHAEAAVEAYLGAKQ